jgi:hypothetical protein
MLSIFQALLVAVILELMAEERKECLAEQHMT